MLAPIAAIAVLSVGAAAGGACLPPKEPRSQAIAFRIEVAQGAKDLATAVDGTFLTPIHSIGAGQNVAGSGGDHTSAFFINGTSNAEGSTVVFATTGDFGESLSFSDNQNGVWRANLNIGGSYDKHYYIAGEGKPVLKGPKSFIMCDSTVEGQQERRFGVLKGLDQGAKVEKGCVNVDLVAYCTEFIPDTRTDLTNAYNVRCNPFN